jgi:AraC family transcriptional regulator, exoenzyme S synthesis regulatory protein ExsA
MVNLHNYIIENRLFKKLNADNLLFAEYKCLINEERGDVWSHNNYFAFGLRGKKIWRTMKGDYPVESGRILFVQKGANVVYQYFEEDFLALFVFVPDDFIKSVIEKHMIKLNDKKDKLKIDSIIPLKSDEILESYFRSLMSYFTRSKPPAESLLKLKFEELLVNLLTGETNKQLIQCLRDIYLNTKTSVKEIMENNFSRNLTLEEFAKLTARSLSTFKRDFYNIYKKTPGKWLIEKRLEYSRYLILNSSKSMEDILYESGFRNRSHFIKVFKSKFGITPLRLRSSKHSLRKVV